jgi:hypothetical protein
MEMAFQYKNFFLSARKAIKTKYKRGNNSAKMLNKNFMLKVKIFMYFEKQ